MTITMASTNRLGALVAVVFGASLLAVLAPAGPAAAATQTTTVQAPIRIEVKSKETPIPDGTSYYCAVGSFVSFSERAGWTPETVTYDYPTSATTRGPYSEPIGGAPYDDGASINGLTFPPGGAHQTQIGDFSYRQGGTPGDGCLAMQQRARELLGDTAIITYTRTTVDVSQKCAKAQNTYKAANAKVRTVQVKVTRLNTQVKQITKNLRAAQKAGKTGQARSLAKSLASKKTLLSGQRKKLTDAKKVRARQASAAAKACRD